MTPSPIRLEDRLKLLPIDDSFDGNLTARSQFGTLVRGQRDDRRPTDGAQRRCKADCRSSASLLCCCVLLHRVPPRGRRAYVSLARNRRGRRGTREAEGKTKTATR